MSAPSHPALIELARALARDAAYEEICAEYAERGLPPPPRYSNLPAESPAERRKADRRYAELTRKLIAAIRASIAADRIPSRGSIDAAGKVKLEFDAGDVDEMKCGWDVVLATLETEETAAD